MLSARVRDALAAHVWVPLGYNTREVYCHAEFGMSRVLLRVLRQVWMNVPRCDDPGAGPKDECDLGQGMDAVVGVVEDQGEQDDVESGVGGPGERLGAARSELGQVQAGSAAAVRHAQAVRVAEETEDGGAVVVRVAGASGGLAGKGVGEAVVRSVSGLHARLSSADVGLGTPPGPGDEAVGE
ncbi:hypothetical protein GCM10010343_11430 [Streptomyces avidinii]|uniref:Uncharacterized protein n=1 Tax=Streptomyces avidinii TaxID=1895 RepID=A0ABS4KXC1_STRAV|nr:hypothetical protein [Streptomyces avidinii]GGY88005.1 hypothetical protein GCM10010343_11430 [Streptomyces avidinii]